MGKSVVVDSDDLGKLITSAAIIKNIEQCMDQRKNDPFISKDNAALRIAHDTLSKQWRASMRDEQQFDPLSDEAVELLKMIGSGSLQVFDQSNADEPIALSIISDEFKELRLKMMVEIGNRHDVTFWKDTGETETDNKTARLMVRLSARGKSELWKIEAASIAAAEQKQLP